MASSSELTHSQHPAVVPDILALVAQGAYEDAARRLEAELQQTPQQNVTHVTLLAAAHELILACRQQHEEAAAHLDAHREAEQREAALRHQVETLISLMRGQSPPPGTPPTLWDRMQTLLKRPLAESDAPPPAKEETPAAAEETAVAQPTLSVQCFGGFTVHQNNKAITNWHGLKSQLIFKYLLLHKQQPVAKEILMDVFWPDMEPEAARRNLHQAIYSLRQALRSDGSSMQHILFDNDAYSFNPALEMWTDFEEMEQQVKRAQRHDAAGQSQEAIIAYSIAEGLYQGDFLADDLYDDWTRLHREHYRTMYLTLADRLCRRYIMQQDFSAAIALCQRVIQHDSCHEAAHRHLMECYHALKQRHLAIRQYHLCQDILETELALEPAEETRRLYRQLTA